MRGSGGTSGGLSSFLIGICLFIGGIYLLFDSTRMITGHGIISGIGRGFWTWNIFWTNNLDAFYYWNNYIIC